MKPTDKLKKALNAVQDWVQKPDKEYQQALSEAFTFKPEPNPAAPPQSAPAGVPAAIHVNVRPPAAVPSTPRPIATSKSTKEPAGLKQRAPGEKPRPESIVQNRQDDTVYIERNNRALLVHQRYVKYGEKIAAAVLSKTFVPNGLRSLLEKLGLSQSGSELGDHDRIIGYIERNGLEDFCAKVGIRTEGTAAQDPEPAVSENSKSGADSLLPIVKPYQSQAQKNAARQDAPRKMVAARETVRRPAGAAAPQPVQSPPPSIRQDVAPVSRDRRAQENSGRKPLSLSPKTLQPPTKRAPAPQSPKASEDKQKSDTGNRSIKAGIRENNRLSPADLRPTPLAHPADAHPPVSKSDQAMTPRPIPRSAENRSASDSDSTKPPMNKAISDYLKVEFETSFDF